jgi:hypothetical protein
MKLPLRLQQSLLAVVNNEGEDVEFALGHVSRKTAINYISQLKAKGMAYTSYSGSKLEVWAHPKGRELANKIQPDPMECARFP